MFRSPEHALAVCYWMLALPIEPKNATQMIIEMLRERFDVDYEPRELSGLTPHDWHCQASMTISFVERSLADKPLLLAAVRAEYSTGVEMAHALQRVSDHVCHGMGKSAEPLVYDALVGNLIRKRPALRTISDKFDIPKSTLGRWLDKLKEPVGRVRHQAIMQLEPLMVEAGLFSEKEVESIAA